PLVTSVLDVVALVIPDYARRLPARLYTALVSASARGSTQVIALSHASKIDIEEHLGLPDERITVTWLAPDHACHPRLGAERDADLRIRYKLPERYVFAIGGFDLRKQFKQLLLAWTWVAQAEGADCALVIAGREPLWRAPLFPDLRAHARELGISDHILWLGEIDEQDKPALYRMARVFAFPSRYEGFGLPVLEAMACGTPVVANEISCLPELVEDGAFLVEPGNARAMAGAIIALLNQEPLRQAQRNAGLARATHFNWRRTAQQTLRVYERALAGG
ncbi:MAG: glycosyltransferase family 1 protein, partial [Anaerolineaceae bacterium]|nr:glycosyltransferase family 1 protein [Anaerolineaceae bacterium]